MSWVTFRNAVEVWFEGEWAKLEPTVQADLVSAVKVGIATYQSSTGDTGTRYVTARNATASVLIADGHQVLAALVNSMLSDAVAALSAPAVTPAPAT